MSDDDFDYDEEVEPEVKDQFKRLHDLARQQKALEIVVSEAEDVLKEAKGNLHNVQAILLPEIMAEFGLDSFKTDSGLKITISEKLSAKIKDATRAEAIAWLKAHSCGNLVKNKVEVVMQKGAETEAQTKELTDYLTKVNIPYKQKEDVHHMTLAKTVREMIQDGEEVDRELLNVFVKRTAKIG